MMEEIVGLGGLDLFDPSQQDEPPNQQMFVSATQLLEDKHKSKLINHQEKTLLDNKHKSKLVNHQNKILLDNKHKSELVNHQEKTLLDMKHKFKQVNHQEKTLLDEKHKSELVNHQDKTLFDNEDTSKLVNHQEKTLLDEKYKSELVNHQEKTLLDNKHKFELVNHQEKTQIDLLSVPGHDFNYLPPEPQLGNIEYKLKLVNPSHGRLEHLVTQMKWRLREGNGEAIYEIGVEDDGVMTGLSQQEMQMSLDTLQEMASRLGATLQVLRERQVDGSALPRVVAEVLVRAVPEDQQAIELRICVLGSVDVGKSTLLGVLTQGQLDNGRGLARLNMFRHLHEIQTGRTSSISHEILGFDSEGNSVDYSDHSTSEEICENSSKLMTFIDLAGHQKYLRTTISALTGYLPHYVMLVVSATAGVAATTQEHLGIAVALQVPFFVVITKGDIAAKQRTDKTMENVKKVLKSAGSIKVPLVVETKDDCITAATNVVKNNVVPIFCVSSVTGAGMDLMKRFLHLLPPCMGKKEIEKLEQEQPEFQVDELFVVAGVGTVVGGLVTQGVILEKMHLNIGPFDTGGFARVRVSSIRRNKAACRLVRPGQSAALALDIPLSQLRKGMVLTAGQTSHCRACQYFQASVCVLFHPTEIFRGFQTTVHIGNIRQTAVIEGIHPIKGMKSSDQASVVFRFIKNPEFVKLGAKILFREGRTKGIGRVTKIFPYEHD